jgi:hypothetical protein
MHTNDRIYENDPGHESMISDIEKQIELYRNGSESIDLELKQVEDNEKRRNYRTKRNISQRKQVDHQIFQLCAVITIQT